MSQTFEENNNLLESMKDMFEPGQLEFIKSNPDSEAVNNALTEVLTILKANPDDFDGLKEKFIEGSSFSATEAAAVVSTTTTLRNETDIAEDLLQSVANKLNGHIEADPDGGIDKWNIDNVKELVLDPQKVSGTEFMGTFRSTIVEAFEQENLVSRGMIRQCTDPANGEVNETALENATLQRLQGLSKQYEAHQELQHEPDVAPAAPGTGISAPSI